MKKKKRKRRPCRICGNHNQDLVDVHHFIFPVGLRSGYQQTIKLCRAKGCGAHEAFHNGCKETAAKIRAVMYPHEYEWLCAKMGAEWVENTYPILGL